MAVYRRGKTWWMSFVFEGRRIQESTGFSNRTAALRVEARRKANLLERRAGITRRAMPPKFEEFSATFLAWSGKQHRAKTHELHESNCETLGRFFAGKWLDQITPGLVEDFKQARMVEARRNGKKGEAPQPVSPATVNRALTTLKLLFNHARKCGYAVENPTERVTFLSERDGERMRVVSFVEEAAYLAAASQPLRDVATIIVDTGLRPDETFRIERSNIDFVRLTITNTFGKTKAAARTVRMTRRVFEILTARSDGAGPYIFPMDGAPTRHLGSVRKAHDAAVRRAGIKQPFRLYDLRHTFASRAAEADMDLPTLAATLGHTKLQMTMRYVHPSEAHKLQEAARVEKRNSKAAIAALTSKAGRVVVTPSATSGLVN